MREPALRDVVERAVQNMSSTIPYLIPTCARMPRSGPWEKFSNRNISALAGCDDGVKAAEIDLFPLIRDAVGHCAVPAIMGEQFLKDYPSILEDLFMFDDVFLPLVSGLPPWAPIPSIRRGVKARDRVTGDLLAWTEKFRESLKGNSSGVDFDDVSEVMRQVIKM